MSSVFFVKSVFIINSVYTDFVIMYNLLIHVLRSVVQGNYTVSRHCVHSMTLFLIGALVVIETTLPLYKIIMGLVVI